MAQAPVMQIRGRTSTMTSTRPRVLLLLCAVLCTGGALARPPAERPALPAAQQTFHDAVAEAWAHLPQRQDLAAQLGSAGVRYAAGGTLFPNAPSLNGSYVNDKVLGSNYNYLTAQLGLATPLWLPGEGRATQATAQADGAAVEAAIDAAHLALAQQVLDLAAQAALALGDRNVAARRLATAQALAANLARQFRIGEASQSDALAADADAASAAVTLSNAEAQLGSARAVLAVVVGNDLLPRLDAPGPAAPASASRPAADPLAAHPRIAAAQRAVDAAQASARLVGIENRDSPVFGLQGINEKQPGTKWDTRFGVTFTLPFATEARNAPRRAAAEQAVTQAVVQLVQAQRAVLAAVRQAEALLTGAERGSVAAERAAAGLVKRRGQIGRAWQVGEMPLIEVVRANALAYDAEAAREKAHTDLAAARLRLRLAQGVLL